MPDRLIDNPLVSEERRVVLTGVIRPGDAHPHGRPLEELAMLAETAKFEVSGMLTQKLSRINPNTYIGKGKVAELAELVAGERAALVIFDNDLSPAQMRNLEAVLKLRVMDRSELILEIFAMHARTGAAKIQVELARLEYSLPRLRRMWTHLDREKGGIGLRGGGEQQIEIDRRRIGVRIGELKKKLVRIRERRERQVASRKDAFAVSLVGYTNAGKSTLLNALTGVGVFESERLFATLDTKTCIWDAGCRKKVLLSDTVGFIENLPHDLIASFHATLEEVRRADLLLHVVDVASPEPEVLVRAVEKVLREIGCKDKRIVTCLNKSDIAEDRVEIEYMKERYAGALEISAKTGKGLDALAECVCSEIDSAFKTVQVSIDPANGKLLAEIARRGDVLWQKMVDGRLHIAVSLDVPDAGWLMKKPGVDVVDGDG